MSTKLLHERIDETYGMIAQQEETSLFRLGCLEDSFKSRIKILEQQIKDSSQATSLCSKSGIEQSNTFCSRLEVRIKRLEEKLASACKKESKPKTTFNVSLPKKSKKD